MGDSDKWDAVSRSEDLHAQDTENDGALSSDDEDADDAITLYDGSAPSSPIESFGNPSPSLAATHPNKSQFSMVVLVGTPNIIQVVQSKVTASPSSIRDAWLAAAPYSTLLPKPGSGTSSQHTSTPPTRPPSCGPALPTTTAEFDLKPSTATPLSYVLETQPPPLPSSAVPP